MKKYFLFITVLALLILPSFSFAQMDPDLLCSTYPDDPSCNSTPNNTPSLSTCGSANLGDMLCRIAELLKPIIPILFTLGIIYFVYGIITYVIGDDEEAKQKGRDRIFFGIIGFAVIVSIWGLVAIVKKTFGVGNGTTPTKVQLQGLLPQ